MAQRCIRCMHMSEEELCPVCGWPGSGENSNHQLPVGTVLRDRYQIGKVLGQGGFGITYLAWDLLMDKQVAVKEFYPGGTVFRRSNISTTVECITEEAIPHYDYSKERFLREARALVQFRDLPEVVDILDFISENNTSYIVMEYIRGMDLAKYIQSKGGKLSVGETFRILRPVMEALAKVHKGGIVHRDISPDNIVLDPEGGAKLLDFGAVRVVEDPDVNKDLNKSTEAILKQGFAPLEQYNSRGSLGPWTDEYAMCATVWYCLTGKVPEEVSIRMTEGIDPDWSTVPGLPEHQQMALAKGFSCRAKDRYRSIDELLEALFPEVEELSLPVPEPVEAAPVKTEREKTKAPKRPAKKGWIWAIPAVLVIALAVAVFIPKGGTTADEETVPQEEMFVETTPVQIQTQPTLPLETEPPTVPLSPEEEAYLQAEALLEEGKLGEAAIAFGKLAGFSDARERSFAVWDKIAVRDTFSTGYLHTIGLKTDHTAVAIGSNEDGQCNVENWQDIVAVSAGGNHTLGLKADGTVVASGDTERGKCDVDEWTDIVAISTGLFYSAGLRADGAVVVAGTNMDLKEWGNIVAISAGYMHIVGLKADGTVVAEGMDGYTQCDVDGWTDIIAISAGEHFTLGLKADGTVISTGTNNSGQCNTQDWKDIVAISAGGSVSLGIKADGTVVIAGSIQGQQDIRSWADIVALSAGYYHTVGITADGTLAAAGNYSYNMLKWTDILLPKERASFR